MTEIFPIEFEYDHQVYFGIVRARQKEHTIELKVRIMNARIDRIFYGNHVFKVKDNHIVPEERTRDGKVAVLRSLIQHSIEQRLIS